MPTQMNSLVPVTLTLVAVFCLAIMLTGSRPSSHHGSDGRRGRRSAPPARTIAPAPALAERVRRDVFLGTNNKDDRQLINPAYMHAQPASSAVAVWWSLDDSPDTTDFLFCSAVAVGPHQIITSAHCLYDTTLQAWKEDVVLCVGQNWVDGPTVPDNMCVKLYLGDAWAPDEYTNGADPEANDFAIVNVYLELTHLYAPLYYRTPSGPDHEDEPAAGDSMFTIGYSPFDQEKGFPQFQRVLSQAVDGNTVQYHSSQVSGDSGSPLYFRFVHENATDMPMFYVGGLQRGSVCDISDPDVSYDSTTQICSHVDGDDAAGFYTNSYNFAITLNHTRVCQMCEFAWEFDRHAICDWQSCVTAGIVSTTTTTTTTEYVY